MSTRKKKLDPKKVYPCYDTHNTFFEGGHKVHLMNEETGRCLCGYEPMFHNEVLLDHPESPYKSTLEYVCQPDPDGNICLRCKDILTKRIAPKARPEKHN